jgi:3-oxoacyl-[acyl-carrier-protein] synthase-3
VIARPFAELASVGTAVPPGVLTNHDLMRTLDTSDEWIVERTGIRERRIATPEQTVAMLSREASDIALERAGVTPADLDAIVLATASPDRLLPSTACDLQGPRRSTTAMTASTPWTGRPGAPPIFRRQDLGVIST